MTWKARRVRRRLQYNLPWVVVVLITLVGFVSLYANEQRRWHYRDAWAADMFRWKLEVQDCLARHEQQYITKDELIALLKTHPSPRNLDQ